MSIQPGDGFKNATDLQLFGIECSFLPILWKRSLSSMGGVGSGEQGGPCPYLDFHTCTDKV